MSRARTPLERLSSPAEADARAERVLSERFREGLRVVGDDIRKCQTAELLSLVEHFAKGAVWAFPGSEVRRDHLRRCAALLGVAVDQDALVERTGR